MAEGPGTSLAGKHLKPVLTTKPTVWAEIAQKSFDPDGPPLDLRVDLVDGATGEVLRKGRSRREEFEEPSDTL